MALFRATHKLRQSLQLSSTLSRHSIRLFSTGTEQPQPSNADPFPRPPNQGPVYASIFGINEDTQKRDIINMFEGCNLSLNDIKVNYDRMFNPWAMLVQFPSASEYMIAFKENYKKGGWFKLSKVDRQQWDVVKSSDGNYVLLQGIPPNANLDDVERVLSGFNYDSSSFEIFTRSANGVAVRMAVVRFPSHIEAMNVVIQKNGSYCLNSRLIVRHIQ